MKREEIYCDVCGQIMTYQDAEGETCVHGIEVDQPLRVQVTMLTDSGCSSRSATLRASHYCSVECFMPQVEAVLGRIVEGTK